MYTKIAFCGKDRQEKHTLPNEGNGNLMQGMRFWPCCIKPSQPFRKTIHQPVRQLQLQTHFSKQGDMPNRVSAHLVRKIHKLPCQKELHESSQQPF